MNAKSLLPLLTALLIAPVTVSAFAIVFGSHAVAQTTVVPVSPIEIEETLNSSSQMLPDGSFYNVHTFDGQEGQSVNIEMESQALNTYLILVAPDGLWLAENNDAVRTNSRITITLPTTGTYRLLANSYADGEAGDYSLTLRSVSAEEVSIATQLAEADQLFNHGYQQSQSRQFLDALSLYQQALEMYRNPAAKVAFPQESKQKEGETLNNLGFTYINLGQYQEAINLLEQALAIARELDDRQGEGNALGNFGIAYRNLGQYQEAIEFYEQQLLITREIGDRQGEGNALNNLGNIYADLGQYQEAISFFEDSLFIFREIDHQWGERTALRNLGFTYADIEQYEVATNFHEQALVIAREIGDQQAEGITLGNLGSVYRSLGQYQEAIAFYEQSLNVFREIGDRQGERIALRNLGLLYADSEEYEAAIGFHEQSLAMFREIGDQQGEGESLGNLGIAYENLERYEAAIDFYGQSFNIFREIGDRQGEGSALGNLGNAYENLGQYEVAINFYEQSLAVFHEISDRQSAGRVMVGLGNAYNNLGEYEATVDFHEQSLDIFREISDQQGEGKALGNLGNAYENLGQYEVALDFYEQSLAIFRDIGDQQGEGNTLGNLGALSLILGQYEVAIDFLEQSLAITREIGDRKYEGRVMINLGNAYNNLGEYETAIDFYEQSLATLREIGDRQGEGMTLSSLGNTHASLGEYQQAIDFYAQGLVIAREIGSRQDEGDGLSNLGSAYRNLERHSQAIAALNIAIEVLESLRNEDIPDAQQITFFDTQRSPYISLQQSLIAQGETNQALVISERGRARAFVSSLAERQNQEAPALPPPSIADIQRTAQAQNATLVQYSNVSFTDDDNPQLYIWVIQPTGEITFRSVDLSTLDGSLSEFITASRDAMGIRSRNTATVAAIPTPAALQAQAEQQRQILQELHTLLIDPIADLLPTDPEAPVIIIPHQELFLVPFAALVDANGDYLIQHHTLLTAPSIQVLQLLGEPQATTATGDPLIIGNPIMPSIWNPATGEEEVLSNLPGAEAEAVAIATALNAEPLLWEQASETAVTRRMATAPLLHFATHGLLDYGDPTATGVQDFPGAIALAAGNGNDGLLTAAEIYDLNLSAELVVLSACDTGRGRITGDGVIGLSRAFIHAGVPQVLVSLWAVPDAPTAELMTIFYAQRELTNSDAQALRQAMLIMLEEYPNPRDWAAFTLIGGAQ